MLFAQMDVLDGKDLYTDWFDFKQTEPLNSNFELYDVNNKNFVINSGSFFILLGGILVFTLAKYFCNKLMVCFSQYSFARSIGLRVYKKSYYGDFKSAGLKLLMESYFDIAMCTLLNVLAFLERKNGAI